ncbi:MAG: glycosyltransferase N-terminal domain-containing protein [Hyphomicrobiaceae bacterium]
MALSAERKTKFNRNAGRALASVIRFVQKSSNVVRTPPDLLPQLKDEHPLILACWHGQFMMLHMMDPGGVKVKAMVARHGDAELIGEAMRQFGVELIRGAGAGSRKKDRGGAHALRAAVKALKDNNTVVMTADVPTGQARRAGEGIVMIARLSGRPIVPVAVATRYFWALKTWSRLTINLPFSKLVLAGGAPIYVPRNASEADLEVYRQRVEDSLNDVTKLAYRTAGANIERATPSPEDQRNGPTPPPKPGFALKTYRKATSALRATTPLMLKFRERRGKEIAGRRDERYGEATAARPEGPMIWFHAASVGETNAILPLMAALGKRRPDLSFLLTTGTVTSAKLADTRLGPRSIHQFVPLDTPQYAHRFIQHWRPDLAVFTESEIWPNLILETESANVPIALVNGRMSKRSFKRWRKSRGLAKQLFGRFTIVLAQNKRMAGFFSDLGTKDVVTSGNLKIDSPPPPVNDAALAALRDSLGTRSFYVCASTHDGEEEIIIKAHKRLSERVKSVCTIIAPRHPERGKAIADLVKAHGLGVAMRSKGELPTEKTDIYIADTIGELGTFYKLTSIAYIGGSLVDRGGQNPIEAVHHDAAVLTGPSKRNFQDEFATLERNKALQTVTSSDDLAFKLAALIKDETEVKRMQSGARTALTSLEGALGVTVANLLPILPQAIGLKRAS